MRNIHYGSEQDQLIKTRLSKLKKLIEIVKNYDNDFQRAIELRRVYPTYKAFRQSYYKKTKWNEDKTEKIIMLINDYASYEEELKVLDSLFRRYEEEGFFELAMKEDKFLLRQANDLDSRYIINAYINDSESYDQDIFFKRYKIDYPTYIACINRVKTNDPLLYTKYMEAVKNNKTKRLVMPIYNINQIIEGIQTGKTTEGKKFDVYEFYRLAPFKGKSIEDEVRAISKDFPKLLIFKKLQQDFYKKSRSEGSEHRFFTYSENLYLFTCCFNKTQAETLKKYMDENNIKNLTPIYRESTVNFYNENTETEDFTKDDAIEIFDTMATKELPFVKEVYNRLKDEKITIKKVKKNN